ncbi:MAG: efflux system, outer rane lipoprotein NodT family [Gammaproteobacteria bacterium]|nr:efflux system, outer rane lipoprotein NodT family [Gammaproteobacteria bacterium]
MRYGPWLVAVAAVLLASCTVGPNYVRPDTPRTAAYKESPPEAYKNPGVWQPAQPSDDTLRANWWELFGDEQLNALEQQVVLGNQDLKVAEARFREARALIGYARASEFPTIGVGSGIRSLRDSSTQPYFPLPSSHATGDFVLPADLSYEVDLWGRIRRSVVAAGKEAQATAADLQSIKLSLHAELAIDYFELRSADAQQHLLEDTVDAYSDSLQLARNRLDGGVSPESDVAQAKTQLDTARVQATDIAVRRAQYEHAIAVLIGQPPASFGLAAAPFDPQPPAVPIGIPSELLERRPDIAAAERRAGEANEQIGIAIAAYYPSLSLNGVGGFESSSSATWFDWPSRLWAVGLSMAEIVYDGGRRHAKTEAARAQYDAVIAGYRQTTLTAFQQVEDHLAALSILEREAQQQDEAVDSAKNNLRLFTDRYVGGRDNYLQVITAQTAYLDNERNQVEIRRRRMDATVLLVKALGGGWTAAALPKLEELARSPLDRRL